MKGRCKGMCPRDELFLHATVPSVFERDPETGEYRPELAIKQFHRSDAGKTVTEDMIRPLPVLQKTLDHIINVVVGQIAPRVNPREMYDYVRDKLRSIRQDMTYQGITGPDAIEILEKIALFFIHCGARFANSPDFDLTQNFEQVTQTLLTLDEEYDKYFQINNSRSPNEAEFRAAHILVSISEDMFMQKLVTFSNDILSSPAMKIVLDLRAAYTVKSIDKFVAICKSAPSHLKCVAICSSKALWEDAVLRYRKTTRSTTLSRDFFERVLKMTPQIFKKWNEQMYVNATPQGLQFDKSKTPELIRALPPVIPASIKAEIDSMKFIDFFSLKRTRGGTLSLAAAINSIRSAEERPKKEIIIPPVMKEIPKPKSPEPISKSEESEEEPQESKTQEDSSEEMSTEQQNTEEEEESLETKQNEATPSETVEEEESSSEYEYEEVTTTIIRPKVTEKGTVLNPFEKPPVPTRRVHIIPALIIESLVPRELPAEYCFATVGICAGDGSKSARFALERFRTSRPIIFCSEVIVGRTTLYLYITRNDNIFPDAPLGSILYCEEQGPSNDEDIPIVKFSIGESPYFTFDAKLKAAISKAITPFYAFNVTDFAEEIAATTRSRDPNCVGTALLELAKEIESIEFQENIVPFRHGLLTRSDIRIFTQFLRKVDPNTERLGLQPFVIPLSEKFDIEQLRERVFEAALGHPPNDEADYENVDDLISQFYTGLSL